MKNLVFTLVAFFFSMGIYAQTLPEIIAAYEKYCNEIVNDTVEQVGYLNYELVPVKDKDGKVLNYAFANPDTIWSNIECSDYKDYDGVYFGSSNIGYTFPSTGNLSIVTNHPITGTLKAEKTEVKITRQYVCEVKRRRIVPFSNKFWEFAKTYKGN